MLVLSGDIGGTTARLRLVDCSASGQITLIKNDRYKSGDYLSFGAIIDDFLKDCKQHVDSACFGVAGPIIENAVKFTNLAWDLKIEDIKSRLQTDRIELINDFVAIGYGLATLVASDIVTLQIGKKATQAIQAYLGAGTGLGVGFITYEHGAPRVHPTEGGHIDFAPIDDEEISLLGFLRQKHHRVSYERVLSGHGLVNIYEFLCDQNRVDSNLALPIDPHEGAIAITAIASQQQDSIARKTIDVFIRILAQAAGNLALTTLPFGGLYIVGGIVPKILPLIDKDSFLRVFRDKGRMAKLISDIPMHLVLNQDVGLQGATWRARSMLNFV